ncbi:MULTISPECIES: glycosyltransferase family 2 protein [Burkholderia]|uniref:Glycosyl transferase family 2 n=1 Tax=Burkholderia contaminans TaxID=488447 RepID=A0A6P2Y166_9BURK|nr:MULTISPECIES: glycosyltransferase family 2 protein [Burkholderia]MDN7491917.1 glycosyltransferase family 2 protein [Burkholderia sp. AU45274]VWD14268.1 glycosyl transferase family 2 [Burkholderia contaminans]
MLRNILRFHWGLKSLLITRGKEGDHAKSTSTGPVVEIEIKSKIPAGWYMLEIEVLAEGEDVIGRLNLDEAGHKNNTEWNVEIPLANRKIGKRIVLIDKMLDDLRVGFNRENMVRSISHFKLVRLSAKFAESRIDKKLTALHPDYVGVNALEVSLKQKWRDYCLIFRDLSGGIPYAIWIKEYERNILNSIFKSEADRMARMLGRRGIFIDQDIRKSDDVLEAKKPLIGFKENFEDVLVMFKRGKAGTPAVFKLDEPAERSSQNQIDANFEEVDFDNSLTSLDDDDWLFIVGDEYIVSDAAARALKAAIANAQSADVIFGDEDSIDFDGNRHSPYFKGCWNKELFFSKNILSGMTAFRVGALKGAINSISDIHDLAAFGVALEVLDNISPRNIIHVPVVLAHKINEKRMGGLNGGGSLIRERQQLQAYFKKFGKVVNVSMSSHGRRVECARTGHEPLVSLIIPTRNRCDLLRQCIDSIFEKTRYQNFEIIVIDNGSNEAESLKYLSEINEDAKISVVRMDVPFNYSLLNNRAVELARGEFIGLLNNDIEVLSPHWLDEMVFCAQQEGVGAVGAKLLYPDGRIQHAGVIMGIHGGADHVHRYEARSSTGYFGNACYVNCYLAVTAACLIVKKSLFEMVGGLDEESFVVAFNDVDFCLKLHDAGYRNVWTPHAELFHHESASRGLDDNPEKIKRALRELECMRARWGKYIQDDPVYNPNLSLNGKLYTLASPSRVGIATIARRGF